MFNLWSAANTAEDATDLGCSVRTGFAGTTERQKGGHQMKTSCIAAVVVLFGVQAFAGIGPGTIETGFGGNLHLSPEPWELTADMYLLYFISETLGFGPFWEVQKMGNIEDAVYFDGQDFVSGTYESAFHYRIGALAKMYLPVTFAEGKLTPYVMVGGGLVSLPKAEWEDPFKEETENKFGFVFELSADYWIADSWTIWAGYRGFKISGDADTYYDMIGRDITDFQSEILVGLSHFIMK
jgi:opacity protein-like surface antigen